MRIFCHVVVKNEANRYWDSWLRWHVPIFPDGVHVFDDDSSDETVEMASRAGAIVSTRACREPSFMDHEGRFRQMAWRVFEAQCEPQAGDWVFCIDSDEFLCSHEDEVDKLHKSCEWSNIQGRGAFMVSVPEVFDAQLDPDTGQLTDPKVRVDGWWGKIMGTRLFRYQEGGIFADKAMGSGSEPTYVPSAPRTTLDAMWLMHYGYALPEDRQKKYERYSGMAHGHSDAHVQSIVQEPFLVPWEGPRLPVYVGSLPAPGPGEYITLESTTPGLEEHPAWPF